MFAKSRARSNGILMFVNNRIKYSGLENAATYHTPLRCIGPIFTTWRVFSLLRMPSRRPRVIPATFNSFVPLIMWLSAPRRNKPLVLHYIALRRLGPRTFSASNTDSTSLYLVAETAFVLPERRGDSRLHAGRRNLTRCVESAVLVLHGPPLPWDTRESRRWREHSAAAHRARHRWCRGRRR